LRGINGCVRCVPEHTSLVVKGSNVTTLTAATPAAMELQVNGVPHAPGNFLVGKDSGPTRRGDLTAR
jgi:hypothetical protein